MAPSVHTLICLLITLFVVCYCSPIKPQSPNQGATDVNECTGNNCDQVLDYTTDTVVNVYFPENLTDAVLSSLPVIEASQRETVDLLNGTLIFQENILASQNKVMVLQEKSSASQDAILVLLNKTVALLEKNGQHLENIEAILTAALTNHQPNNTTATTDLPSTEPDVVHNQLTTPSSSEIPPARDCQDIAARGFDKSGPYIITPPDGLGSFEVYCDLESYNGGWTVFQKRFDGSVDFFRNWTDYVRGFGDASGEYWLGLKNIHRLISDGTTWALLIDLESFAGETAYAAYDRFKISDAVSNYRLYVGGYSGNAGDSLKYTRLDGHWMHNRMPFSTYDQDNDATDISNCADYHKGGWWYNACHAANLNGLYLGIFGNVGKGMTWYTWKQTQSLKSTQMKIRCIQ